MLFATVAIFIIWLMLMFAMMIIMMHSLHGHLGLKNAFAGAMYNTDKHPRGE